MENPAIAPAGVRAAGGLFSDTNNAGIRLTFTEVSGDAQADHSTADDEEVTRGHLVSLELHFQCDRVPSNEA